MSEQTENDVVDLDNRKLVLIFFGFLVICGCFFVAGYILGNRADTPPPMNYADANAARNLEKEYGSIEEARGLMDETDDEPVLPPPAVTEQTPAQKDADAVSTALTPAASAPAVVADKPNPQPKETSDNRTAKAPAGKTASSAKQASAAKTFYSVQIAAFRALRLAEIREKELKAKGFEPWIEHPQTSGDYYRVRVGRFATRAEAGQMESRLKKSGFDTMITEITGN